MKNIYILFTVFILSFFILKPAYSQNFHGFATDNYAGVTGMFYQPASIVDSRYKFDMELIGFGTRIENNWWAMSNSILYNPSVIDDSTYIEDNITVIDNNDAKTIFQGIEARTLSFMFNIGDKSAFGFSARVRQVLNIDNIDNDAAELILNKNDVSSLFGQDLHYQNMWQSTIAWAEYGLTYAQVIVDNKRHFLKAGLTAKLLQGMGAAYLYETDMKYTLVNQDSALNVDADFKFGATSNFEDIMQFKFGATPSVGFDIGVVYEYRPKYKDYLYDMDGEEDLWMKDRNKYLLKVSFSVLDIGQMKFEKQYGNDFSVHESNFDFNNIDIGSIIELADSTQDDLTSNEKYFYYRLPTTVNLNVDYRIARHFYVNASGRLALNQGFSHYSKAHYLSSGSITPRYESKWFGAALPVRYNQFKQLAVGLALRIGPVWIGSNSLLAVSGIKKESGELDLYMAIKIPIMYKAPRDDDGDLVSNKLDECDNDKGPLELNGCPDSDGDGIANKDDACPYTAGLTQFNGCPDTDGDGIEDKYDNCPDIPGSKLYSGCPDTDEDGIIDMNDSCPKVAGPAIYHGCPDTDGDSIPDNLDDCPDAPGLLAFNGCPDTDGDGITDALDLCPDVAGLDSLQGCPYTDTDGDSIQDKYDQCPKVAGPKENSGCPYADTDNDSVPDKDDLCPMTPGPVSNNGCPVIEEKEQEILNTAFSNIRFVSGKAILMKSSYASLDELAELLIKKSDFRLLIEGHTDNVGRDAANMRLSQKRSMAVKKYLVQKNVDASKIDAKWYGEAKPIADNKTEEGRKENRRVELKVIFD